ncbi:MAG: hypothetical protein WKG07_07590 [Hymenobacter sp.]
MATIPTPPRRGWPTPATPFGAAGRRRRQLAQHHRWHSDWPDLALEQQLGEGASGVIYRARCAAGRAGRGGREGIQGRRDQRRPTPQRDAGLHRGWPPPQLNRGSRAKSASTRPGPRAWYWSSSDPAYGNLAGPPSLATCTRDVYAPGTTFHAGGGLCAWRRGIAAAARALARPGHSTRRFIRS